MYQSLTEVFENFDKLFIVGVTSKGPEEWLISVDGGSANLQPKPESGAFIMLSPFHGNYVIPVTPGQTPLEMVKARLMAAVAKAWFTGKINLEEELTAQ